MKVKKLEIFENKNGSKACKWSRLNGPGTEISLSHSILELDEFPFPIINPLWGNKNWPPIMKVKMIENF